MTQHSSTSTTSRKSSGKAGQATKNRAAPDASDYYAVLDLTPEASEEEIGRAFRRLAKRWHPDLFVNAPAAEKARAEQRMRALIQAHATLEDAEKRRRYDASRRAAPHAEATRSSRRKRAPSAAQAEPAEAQQPAPVVVSPSGARNFGVFLGALTLLLALITFTCDAQGRMGDGAFAMVMYVVGIALAFGAIFLFADQSAFASALNAFLSWAPPIDERLNARTGKPRRKRHPRPHSHSHHRRDEEPADDETRPHTESDAAEPGEPEADDPFARLVEEALAGIPERFAPYLENVVVQVEDEPSATDLRLADIPPGGTLLGLYKGTPLIQRDVYMRGAAYTTGPEIITLFQGPIERACHGEPDAIRRQARATILRELARHAGVTYDEGPDERR